MNEKSETVKLADVLEQGNYNHYDVMKAASELRRLHSVNQELLEALKEAALAIEDWGGYASEYFQEKHDLQGDIDAARYVIDKAEAA